MPGAQQLRKTLDGLNRLCHNGVNSITALGGNRHLSWPIYPSKTKMAVACSHMHSFQTVFLTLETLREDASVVDIEFVDLLVDGSRRCKKEKIRAVRDLIIDTSTPSGGAPVYRPRNTAARQWQNIELVDTVSTKEKYREYKEQKGAFLDALRGYSQDHTTLPLSFRLKIELYPSMDLFAILQIFQELIHDESVESVEFPEFLYNMEKSEIAERLVSQLDPVTLAWRGKPLELFVSFADDHTMIASQPQQHDQRRRSAKVFFGVLQSIEEESESSFEAPSQRPVTPFKEFLKECVAELERLLFTRSHVLRCSGSKELSVLSSINSSLSTIDF
ncbi:expressed unknown protein [Seminavis robusta]|uniref:Uncharacterized protein n=1 Tax=Seminavis robusta TaxID=568900 RepID=A0A9N8DRI3_9STRA|nr:expressed unknown protein [Seminavis robusta]|eukprot:Sro237_g095210.1 n/a (332) ;mRNA; r:22044-23039